jgi:hypothetical protein
MSCETEERHSSKSDGENCLRSPLWCRIIATYTHYRGHRWLETRDLGRGDVGCKGKKDGKESKNRGRWRLTRGHLCERPSHDSPGTRDPRRVPPKTRGEAGGGVQGGKVRKLETTAVERGVGDHVKDLRGH